jgi:hypothetical protein
MTCSSVFYTASNWLRNSHLLFVVYLNTNIGSITITRSAIIFYCTPDKTESRDSVVSIATGYRLHDGGVGVRVPAGSKIFSSPRPDWL